MKSSTIKRIIWLTVIAAVVAVTYRTFVSAYPVMPETNLALISDDDVSVTDEPYLTFSPAGEPRAGLIFYTGARVEPEAYASMARIVAESGYLVAIPRMPFNFALLGQSRAGAVISDHPDIDTWVVAGHSLGGAMAASFVDSSQRVDGLALIAAYPGESIDMSLRRLPVTVIYGDLDRVSTPDEIEAAAVRLPEDTEWEMIGGANHAQFGSYGAQPGDGVATIGRSDQQTRAASALISLLRDVD